MKNNTIMKYTLVVLVILSLAAGAFAGIKSMSRRRAAANQKDHFSQKHILDGTKSLKEEARQAGAKLVGYKLWNVAPTYMDIDEVTRRSSAVVVGTVTHNMSRLSGDEREMFIDSTVSVNQVLKGNLKPGDSVTVSIPGGALDFADGTSVEVRTPWFKKMQKGQNYILFLTPGGGTFATVGGPQGVFTLPSNGLVESHSGRLNDPIWKYNGMSADDFTTEVRQALKKKN